MTQQNLPRANHEKSLSTSPVEKKKVLKITEVWIALFIKEIVPDNPFYANHRTSQHPGGIFCIKKNSTNKPSFSLFSTLVQRSWIAQWKLQNSGASWGTLRYFRRGIRCLDYLLLHLNEWPKREISGSESPLAEMESKRPQTGSLNFSLNEPGAKLAHGSSNCPKVFQNVSTTHQPVPRGTGPCVLWGKTSIHGKNHSTTTPMEIKLNGFTIMFSLLMEMQLFPSTPSLTHLSLQCSILSSL